MTFDGYKFHKESDEIVDVSDNVMITNEIGLANMASETILRSNR